MVCKHARLFLIIIIYFALSLRAILILFVAASGPAFVVCVFVFCSGKEGRAWRRRRRRGRLDRGRDSPDLLAGWRRPACAVANARVGEDGDVIQYVVGGPDEGAEVGARIVSIKTGKVFKAYPPVKVPKRKKNAKRTNIRERPATHTNILDEEKENSANNDQENVCNSSASSISARALVASSADPPCTVAKSKVELSMFSSASGKKISVDRALMYKPLENAKSEDCVKLGLSSAESKKDIRVDRASLGAAATPAAASSKVSLSLFSTASKKDIRVDRASLGAAAASSKVLEYVFHCIGYTPRRGSNASSRFQQSKLEFVSLHRKRICASIALRLAQRLLQQPLQQSKLEYVFHCIEKGYTRSRLLARQQRQQPLPAVCFPCIEKDIRVDRAARRGSNASSRFQQSKDLFSLHRKRICGRSRP